MDFDNNRQVTTMKQIAIIDDDIYIGNMLEELLTGEGYTVLRAYSGTEALLLLSNVTPDLVLLDLMLPGLAGEDVLQKIKNIPVIIMSAKVSVEDKVCLLLEGASDYITKPFDTRELLARIAVQLRNSSNKLQSSILSFQEIRINLATHEVSINGHKIHLTKTEYAILKQLLQNSRQVVTKSRLLESIGNDTPDCVESSLKVHISNLRRKLRDIHGKDYIESVWGIGFKLRE